MLAWPPLLELRLDGERNASYRWQDSNRGNGAYRSWRPLHSNPGNFWRSKIHLFSKNTRDFDRLLLAKRIASWCNFPTFLSFQSWMFLPSSHVKSSQTFFRPFINGISTFQLFETSIRRFSHWRRTFLFFLGRKNDLSLAGPQKPNQWEWTPGIVMIT